jgi:ABC-type phosphonate transport system ATPase subunit
MIADNYIILYVIVSFVALAALVFVDWYGGFDLTVQALLLNVILSLLPVVNVVLIVFCVFEILVIQHSVVLLKGRKR